MSVKPGYVIGRDSLGLTENERKVLMGLSKGKTLTAVGQDMGLSRQRASALAGELVNKGWLVRGDKRGQYGIDAKKLPVIESW